MVTELAKIQNLSEFHCSVEAYYNSLSTLIIRAGNNERGVHYKLYIQNELEIPVKIIAAI